MEPVLVVVCCLGKGVVIAYLCVVVIAWIRITTGTICQAVAYAVIIVPLHANDLVLPQNRENTIGIWPKTPHIAQAIDGLYSASVCIIQRCLQCKIVVVASTKHSNGVTVLFSIKLLLAVHQDTSPFSVTTSHVRQVTP